MNTIFSAKDGTVLGISVLCFCHCFSHWFDIGKSEIGDVTYFHAPVTLVTFETKHGSCRGVCLRCQATVNEI